MGEEGGLLAASETSYHKWRRGRWSTGGLCVGTGRGIECLWPCPRDADTADDEPGQSGQTQSKTQTQRFVLACMGGPAVAPAAHRLYVGLRVRRPYKMKICGWRARHRAYKIHSRNPSHA